MKNCKISRNIWHPNLYLFRRKKEEHDKMAMGDAQMGEVDPGESHAHDSSGEELTLSILLNRISGGKYKHPNEFWIELGQVSLSK